MRTNLIHQSFYSALSSFDNIAIVTFFDIKEELLKHKKEVVAIAVLALGCLVAAFCIYRCCLKNTHHVEQKKDLSPNQEAVKKIEREKDSPKHERIEKEKQNLQPQEEKQSISSEEKLKKELDSSYETVVELGTKNDRLEAEVKKLREANQERDQKIEKLKAKLDRNKKELVQKRDECLNLERDVQHLTAEKNQNQAVKDELKKQGVDKVVQQAQKIVFVWDAVADSRLIRELRSQPSMVDYENIDRREADMRADEFKKESSTIICLVKRCSARVDDNTDKQFLVYKNTYGEDRTFMMLLWLNSEHNITLNNAKTLIPSTINSRNHYKLVQFKYHNFLRQEDEDKIKLVDPQGAAQEILKTIKL